MKPLAEAQREVLARVGRMTPARVPIDAAIGLVLAEDVRAGHDIPPFPNSAMDGFAVVGEDVARAPVELEVVEDVAAGHVATMRVEHGTAIKIMTGAPIPAGADTVVRVEDTEASAPGTVRITVPTPSGTSVRPAGGDVPGGSLVFPAGTLLTPPHLGMLAAVGVVDPLVYRRPRVAILSTGDEVVPPGTRHLEPGHIRDTNRPMLRALLTELGVDVADRGIIADDGALLRSTLVDVADDCDAILTSGGVSMGEYDLVKQVLGDLGDIDLWRVAMQPAKPFAFGSIGSTPLFGLPGNPVSVLVAFEQFARPALSVMMGRSAVFRRRSSGMMGERVDTDPEKTVFLRVSVGEGDPPRVRLAGGQSSNVLSAAAAADAFAVIPVGTGRVEEGENVVLEWFRDPAARSVEEVLGP
ncbi:MAG TPA: gephyrin-like molybdotransferase Glp [Acidimicrobiia bacterium]